jgi:hypothetical protein
MIDTHPETFRDRVVRRFRDRVVRRVADAMNEAKHDVEWSEQDCAILSAVTDSIAGDWPSLVRDYDASWR